MILEYMKQESTLRPVLQRELADVEKRLTNLLNLVEEGLVTDTIRQRLTELENRKKELNAAIMEEQIERPELGATEILFWFERFRQGDVNSPAYQRQIIDNFVNSVYVFEDRVVLNFNFKENANTVPLRDVLGSSADGNGPPSQTCSNTSRCSTGSTPVFARKSRT